MKYKVVSWGRKEGIPTLFATGTIIELEPIEEVNTEQDDSWKVIYEARIKYLEARNKSLSEERWKHATKAEELEARNKELDTMLNQQSVYHEKAIKIMFEEQNTKYTALKEITDRMYEAIRNYQYKPFPFDKYEKLSK